MSIYISKRQGDLSQSQPGFAAEIERMMTVPGPREAKKSRLEKPSGRNEEMTA